jgi:hypothetical protein
MLTVVQCHSVGVIGFEIQRYHAVSFMLSYHLACDTNSLSSTTVPETNLYPTAIVSHNTVYSIIAVSTKCCKLLKCDSCIKAGPAVVKLDELQYEVSVWV